MLRWAVLSASTILVGLVLFAFLGIDGYGSYWAVFGTVLYFMLAKQVIFGLGAGFRDGHSPDSPPEQLTCSDCGFSSASSELFAIRKGPSGRVTEAYCPACRLKRTKGSTVRQLRYVAIILLSASALAWFYPDSASVWLFMWLACLYLSMILFILPHELGHALVGYALGGRVFTIIIGAGRRLVTFRVKDTDIAINKVPIGGLTFVAFRDRERIRLNLFLMLLAGPLVHVLAIAAVAVLFEPDVYLYPFDGPGLNVPSLVFFSNAILLAFSMVPNSTANQLGVSGSDGRQMLRVRGISDETINESLPLYYTHEGLRHLHDGRIEEALAWYKQGLARYPDNHSNINDIGLYHLYRGEYGRAREMFRRAASLVADRSGQAYPILINNIAYADLIIGDDDAFEEAGNLTEEAFRLAGWMPNIKNTRGLYLFESGNTEEGMRLMRESMDEAYDPHSMASSACHMAVAFAKTGDLKAARDYIDTARQIDPNCPVLRYAEERIGSLSA